MSRILVVSQHFWPENFRINDICDYFVEQGHEVEVLCGIPNYPTGNFFEGYSFYRSRRQYHGKIKIRRAIEIPRGNNSNIQILINYISFPITSLFHLPYLSIRRYDKIFVFQTSPVLMSLPALILSKIKRTEVTFYVLDLWPENLFSVLTIKNRILRLIATRVSNWHYRQADKLIVLSDQMKDRLIEVTGKNKKCIATIPQACEKIYETDTFDKELHNRFRRGFTILFTGSITPAQSFSTIIDAARILSSEGYSDINWVIVGDGMSRQWLEAKVDQAGLTNNFFFEGLKPIADIPKYTTQADVLLACLVKSDLLEATIPAKVMSYLAAGKPIVLAMDGEVRSLINNVIKCGFAGPTEDSTILAQNIKYMYRLSASERKEMGKRGRQYHLKNFERSILLKKMLDFMFS